MKHRYFIADVFTDRPFSGNQLAVLPEAAGLSTRAMQAIAREFNFAETTFVFPPRDPQHAAQIRIFTPKTEMPFAGHPTVGTAAVLVRERGFSERMVLEENIGPVPVELSQRGEIVFAHLVIDKAPEVPQERPDPAAVAAALSLPRKEIEDAWFADGGVAFCFARLKSREAVDRATLDRALWSQHFAKAWASSLYFFAGDEKPYARMFSPALGIDEDPATGSAAVGMAGVLAARRKEADGIFT